MRAVRLELGAALPLCLVFGLVADVCEAGARWKLGDQADASVRDDGYFGPNTKHITTYLDVCSRRKALRIGRSTHGPVI